MAMTAIKEYIVPLLLIGVLIGMPLGVVSYFKLAASVNEEGRRQTHARTIRP